MDLNIIIFLGIVFMVIGILIIVFSVIFSGEKPNVKVGVGGFIGPIPFGFANDPKLWWIVVILVVLFFLASLLLR